MLGKSMSLAAAVAVAAWLLANVNVSHYLSNELMRSPLARLGKTSHSANNSSIPEADQCGDHAGPHSHALNTYYLAAKQPVLQLLEGSTSTYRFRASADHASNSAPRLELVLPLQGVSPYMPVVSARSWGLVHQLAKAQVFLKNWALLDEYVQALQCDTQLRFAHPGRVLLTASAFTTDLAEDNSSNSSSSSPAQALFEAAAASVGCNSNKQGLFRDAPASVLVFLPGQPYAAVADIMAVKSAQQQEAISLTLQVVEHPHMVSELEMHAHQTLDEHAHYHFHTPEGVVVDAARFMAVLQQADMAPAELHMFFKGSPGPCQGSSPPANVTNAEAWNCTTCETCNCTTTCIPGFTPNGSLTSTCTNNTNWPTVAGSCTLTPQNCTTDPPTPQNANAFSCGVPVTPGTTCNTTCLSGHSLNSGGSLEVTCTAAGNFTAVNGTCSPSPCNTEPTWPANTNTSTNCSGTASGSSCSRTCDPGFTQQGSLTVTCANGTFSPATINGTCVNSTSLLNCTGQPTWPANSINNTNCANTPNTQCNTTCASGHTATGPLSSTCSFGLWSAVTASCSPNNCTGQPSWPANAVNSTCQVTVSGGTCNTTCASGYTQSAPLVATCTAGNFSAVTAQCNPNNCTGQPSWPANTVNTTCSVTVSGGTCNTTCAANYTLVSGSLTATCTAGNFSSVGGQCVPTNQSVCVGTVQWPQNATPKNCSGTATGSNCTTTCNSGYTLTNGSLVSVCNLGVFSSVNATCSPNSCNFTAGTNPPNPPSSSFTNNFNCPAVTPHGGTCNTTCINGYSQVNGTLISTCVAGNFTAITATCAPTPCNNTKPIWPANAVNITCPFTPHNSVCNTTCLPGYNLVAGSLSSTCQFGFFFPSTVVGTCALGCNSSSSLNSVPNQVPWNCSFTPSNSKCNTTCLPGYNLTSGSLTATCTNGQWSAVSANCSAVGNCSSTQLSLTSAPQSVCNGPKQLFAVYTFTGKEIQGTTAFISRVVNANGGSTGVCTTHPATLSGPQPNGTLVTVICNSTAGEKFAPGANTISLLAAYNGANGCPNGTTPVVSATTTVRKIIGMGMSAVAPEPACTGSSAFIVNKFNYNIFPSAGVNASDVTITATASATVVTGTDVALTCTVTRTVREMSFNVTRGQLVVNCTGNVATPTDFTVTVALTANEPGCDRPRTIKKSSVASVVCCRSGYSWTQPTDPVDPQCFICQNASLAQSKWTPGPYRVRPTNKVVTVAGPMAQDSCSMPRGFVATGSVSMNCLDDNTLAFNVTNRRYSKINTLRMLVTCNTPTWMKPCVSWRAVKLANTAVVTDARFSYRSWNFTLPSAFPQQPWCKCNKIVWGLVQGGTYVNVDCSLSTKIAADLL